MSCNNISVSTFESFPAFSVGLFGNLGAPPESFSLKSLLFNSKVTLALLTWLPASAPAAQSYLRVPLTCRPSLTQPWSQSCPRLERDSEPQAHQQMGCGNVYLPWEAQTFSCPPGHDLRPSPATQLGFPQCTKAPVPGLLLSVPLSGGWSGPCICHQGRGLLFHGLLPGLPTVVPVLHKPADGHP